jgi:hypothetical protein
MRPEGYALAFDSRVLCQGTLIHAETGPRVR